jgi:bifunctional DNase/RNase
VQEMVIYGVSYDMVGKQPIVLLKTAEGKRYLPIWIGADVANAIMSRLQNSVPPRPMTHDLLQSVVDTLGGSVVRVTVTELRENTYYALITLRVDGGEREVDSRPSDAIALAVRAEAPIFAADDVIEESAIELDPESEQGQQAVVEEFRRFLEDVRPEDFMRGGEEETPG